jgi:hypothetical protein
MAKRVGLSITEATKALCKHKKLAKILIRSLDTINRDKQHYRSKQGVAYA